MSRNRLPSIVSVADITTGFRGVIVDVFGVLHDGVATFPDAIDALRGLRTRGTRICLLSNSPRRSAEVAARLSMMKIGQDLYDGLITSGQMVYDAVSDEGPVTGVPLGRRYIHIGPADLSGLLDGLGLQPITSAAQATFLLATGVPDDGSDAALAYSLAEARRHGLPMICANPDLEVDIGCRRIVCAGTVASHYENLGGFVARYGKPSFAAYARALEVLGLPAGDVLAIGDSLETDILGANRAGIASALVMTGIHRGFVAEKTEPDWEGLWCLCRRHCAEPKFILSTLAWR
jgi:HAD superfamily hydrolase (TIGR01459 family)